jgi:crossover junction endodeoxyribonuclease RuvC
LSPRAIYENKKNPVILGIDPGYARLGFGVIRFFKDSSKIDILDYGVLETDSQEKHELRLLAIQKGIQRLITKYAPDTVAIEKIFLAKNRKTGIQVAEARGVVLATAALLKLEIAEYSPLEVKIAITGHGRSSKEDMQEMVKILCSLDQIPEPDDAADGLANALTYIHQFSFRKAVKKYMN